MQITIGDVTYTAEFNGFTPIVYARCFYVPTANGARREKDINEAVAAILATEIPPISALLEILYACIKTANPKFEPGFDAWVKSLPLEAYNLQAEGGWADSVMNGIVQPVFFPALADAVDAEAAEETSTEVTE